MVICSFFLKGTCKFGNRCRNEHTQQATIGFGARLTFGTQQNDRFHFNKNAKDSTLQSKPSINEESLIQLVRKELQDWDVNKVWPFSCFAVQRERPCLPGFVEISPEELRFEAYECKNSGLQPYLQGIQSLNNQVLLRRNQLKSLNDKQLLDEINSNTHQSNTLQSMDLFGSSNKSNLCISQFSNSSQNSGTSFFGNSSSSLFSSNSSSNGIFGSQSSNIAVAGFFSKSVQPSSNSSGGLFGTNQSTEPFGKAIVTTNNNLFSTQTLSAENPFKSDNNANLFSKNSQITSGFFSSSSSSSSGGLFNISSGNLNVDGKSLSLGLFGGATLLNNSSSSGLFSSGSGGGGDGGGGGGTQQTSSSFFQVTANTQPSNPFYTAQAKITQSSSIYEQLRVYKPQHLEIIFTIPPVTPEDVENFKANCFDANKIPKCPPPVELC